MSSTGRPRTRVPPRLVMPVVAALDEEWQLEAKRPDEIVRPGTERDHGLGRGNPALVGRDHPASRAGLERHGVAFFEPAAALNEQRRIGARQPLRIGRAQRIGEMRAAAPGLADMGLERGQSRRDRENAP